jgi:GntR family transcriptional regulator
VSLEPQRSRYQQLADRLRASINSGEYLPGSTMPSEAQLAIRYNVSRPTVNNAMTLLRAEGLVRVERGRGTIVRELPVIHRHAVTRYTRAARERAGGRGAFDGEIRSMGLIPRSDITVSREIPPSEVAEALGISPDSESVIVRRRKMYADDVPVQLAPSFIPAEIAVGTALAEVDSGPGGIISRFADLGYEQTRATESVSIRRATLAEQEFLRLDDNAFVAEIFHVGWTADERAVEVCIHSISAAQWVLDYELPLS